MAKHAISATRAIDIYEFLKQVVTRLDGGMCEYQEGWTDARVAREMDVSNTAVGQIRLDRFGSLKERKAMSVRLTKAEASIAQAFGMSPEEYAQNKMILVSDGFMWTPGEMARLKRAEEAEEQIRVLQERVDRLEEIFMLMEKLK